MNYLLIVVLAVLVISTLMGLKQGFATMVFKTCSMIVALILSFIISPTIAKSLQSNEAVMGGLKERVSGVMNLEERAAQLPDTQEFLNAIQLPDIIMDRVADAGYLENLGIDEFKETASKVMADGISTFLAKTILYALCYLGVFFTALLVLFLLRKTMEQLMKLPLLKQANSLAGMALGLVQGVIIVWILFALVTVIGGTEFGQTLFGCIHDSELLSFIYNNNLLLKFITGKVGSII